MAHIKINRNEFEQLVGDQIDDDYLEHDASYLGVHWNQETEDKWDVEVYPDRPDLLSVEGLARAYQGIMEVDTGLVELEAEQPSTRLIRHDSVDEVRPFVGAVIIRDVELSERILNGLIQFQEKLHKTLGRERERIAIGLHDMENLSPPFTYRAVEPGEVEFTPLDSSEEMNLREITQKHEKGREYGQIVEQHDRYPLITDSRDQVLSFPPVINNKLTEVTEETKDIFIDVTGTDLQTVEKTVSILAYAFKQRNAVVEKVEIENSDFRLDRRETFSLDPEYVREISGMNLSREEILQNLRKMRLGAEAKQEGLKVTVPGYRTDVMHPFDLVEDVVIAQDYREFDPELPNISTEGKLLATEEYTNVIREVMSSAGAIETNTYILSSREKLEGKMEMDEIQIPEMENALSEDFSAVRNWLLPSLMGALEQNTHSTYPQELFEIADVVELDDSPSGASNRRKLAYVKAGNEVDFNDARETLQVIERDLGVDLDVEAFEHDSLKPGRTGRIFLGESEIGIIGEVSDKVGSNWGLETPVAAFELDAEELIKRIREN